MQCPYTAKPPDGVSKRKTAQTDRKEKGEIQRMKPNAEDRQKVSHIRDVKDGKGSKQRGRKTEREEERSAC